MVIERFFDELLQAVFRRGSNGSNNGSSVAEENQGGCAHYAVVHCDVLVLVACEDVQSCELDSAFVFFGDFAVDGFQPLAPRALFMPEIHDCQNVRLQNFFLPVSRVNVQNAAHRRSTSCKQVYPLRAIYLFSDRPYMLDCGGNLGDSIGNDSGEESAEDLLKELRRLKVELGCRTWAELLAKLVEAEKEILLSEDELEEMR